MIIRQRDRVAAVIAATLIAAAVDQPVWSQESQMRQLQNQPTRPAVEELMKNPTPIDSDDEIGNQFLLRRPKPVPQFAASADLQNYYTSNALLGDHVTHDDFVSVGTATAAWMPTWIPDVTGSVFAREQCFRYNRHEQMDFNATAFGFNAGGSVAGLFDLNGGYTATWLDSRATENEFYREGDVSLMLSRTEKFGTKMTLPYGATFDYFHTSPNELNRATYGLFTGVNYAITPKLLGQFFGRYQFEDYQDVSRHDQAFILSVGFTYYFTEWASVRTFASWTTNDSSIQRDYDIANSGLGLNLLLRF